MLMIAIITFYFRAVNHSIRGLAGTRYATRPVAMQCLRLAQLIRWLPGEIVSPPMSNSLCFPAWVLSSFLHTVCCSFFNSLAFFHGSICGIFREMIENMEVTFFFLTFAEVTLRSLHYYHINLKMCQNLFCQTP